METYIDIIDGQEVTVKVYAPYKGPKKLTVKTKPNRSMRSHINRGRKKRG